MHKLHNTKRGSNYNKGTKRKSIFCLKRQIKSLFNAIYNVNARRKHIRVPQWKKLTQLQFLLKQENMCQRIDEPGLGISAS